MRIASFNVENMFQRPKVLAATDWDAGRAILDAFDGLQQVLGKAVYSAADKQAIVDFIHALGLASSDESEWAYLRRSRGQLLRRKTSGVLEVIANGRGDWIGWLELKVTAVDEVATRNTARVIAELGADVLAVVEAENRTALVRFNRDVLPFGFEPPATPWTYDHTMLIDGNDDRGIDVGLYTRAGFEIDTIRSHVDDRTAAGELIFGRDCPEFLITVPGSEPVLVLVNHFKSKGYGVQSESTARRKIQATRAAEIYRARVAEGQTRIVVCGDFNDTPESAALAPLLAGTDLADVSTHPKFQQPQHPGTYATSNDKIDYILLSPGLFATVTDGGIDRSGVWHGPRVQHPWPMLPTLTRPEEAASDHAAIWCDVA